LEKAGVTYALSGQTKAALAGTDKNVHPKSFDVFVSPGDLEKIEKIFPNLVISPLASNLGDEKPEKSVWLGINSQTVVCFFAHS
jgi:hypothetical protein